MKQMVSQFDMYFDWLKKSYPTTSVNETFYVRFYW